MGGVKKARLKLKKPKYEPLTKANRANLGFNGKLFWYPELSVNSAVKGLQHDIKHGKEYIMFPRSGRKALELVRKWFPDAIDNDTNRRI